MKGKILKIEKDLPSFVRFDEKIYNHLAVDIRCKGGNPWTISEIKTLFFPNLLD